MKVLVTGASGFIGQNLVPVIAKKHTVYGLFRNVAKANQFRDVVPLVADLTDKDSLATALKDIDIDIVCHLAAATPLEKNKDTQRKVNVDGTKNLVQSLDSIKLFIYVSGMGVYGDVKGKWVDENSEIAPNTNYARIRIEAENFLKSSNLPLVIPRTGEVYGNGGWFKDFIVRRLKEKSFKVPGKGDYFRSFVHVADVVNAIDLIIERQVINEVVIIADDEPSRFREFIDFTAEKIGVPKPGSVPTFLASAVVGSDLIKLLTSSIKAKNTKAKQILGWEPVYKSYREGIGQLNLT